MVKKKKSVVDKSTFIEKLSSMTKEEIDDIIFKNGKPPKPKEVFIRYESSVSNG